MSSARSTRDTVLLLECRRCGSAIRAEPGVDRCTSCGWVFQIDDGIIVLDHVEDEEDYPRDLHLILSRVEPRHFWFTSRQRIVVRQLRRGLGDLRGRALLDVGCGRGVMLVSAEAAGMMTCGVDTQIEALRLARHHVKATLVCAADLPFKSAFDAALLCDVIEHVADDVDLVRSVSDVVVKGGIVLVTVPAHPSLWSAVDEAWGHRRRYTRHGLAGVLSRAGLTVESVSTFGTFLLPIQALQRSSTPLGLSGKRNAPSIIEHALRVPPGPLNKILGLAMEADAALGDLPFMVGTSLLAIGRRR